MTTCPTTIEQRRIRLQNDMIDATDAYQAAAAAVAAWAEQGKLLREERNRALQLLQDLRLANGLNQDGTKRKPRKQREEATPHA